MAQTNIITRERATYIGEESAFGATPAGSFPNAMTRVFEVGDDRVMAFAKASAVTTITQLPKGQIGRLTRDVGRLGKAGDEVHVASLRATSRYCRADCLEAWSSSTREYVQISTVAVELIP